MRRYAFYGAVAAAALLAAQEAKAQPAAEPSLHGSRTGELAALCGAPAQGPDRLVGLAYCGGFFVAAGQYHQAVTAEGAPKRPVFCLPNPSPTFDQARVSFVAWAQAHPQYAAERAIDGLMRFAAETYPCPNPPAAPARRPRR